MSHNWKNILVSPTTTLRHLLTIIDDEALKLALVVDKKNKLLGSVTDGDIRRALINGKELNELASGIMHTNPIVADINTPKNVLLSIMEEKELLSIPLVENGTVVGLETIHNLLHKPKYDNPVFIMAGGFGTRLRPLTDNCPKPMLNIGDKPILETIISKFIEHGFSNFYISTHYLSDIITSYFGDGSNWGVKIEYVHEETPLGTGGALGLLPKDILQLPLIMVNGDVLTDIDFKKLLAFHIEMNGIATMCVREYEYQVPFGVVESVGTSLSSMVEKPVYRYRVNAGMYVVEPSLFNLVSINEKIDMPTLLEKHLDENVHLFTFYDYWLDIGRKEEFERAQTEIKMLSIS
jgi:dTDP-glucose pyrophosphorylase